MSDKFGAFGDPQFWGSMRDNAASLPQDILAKLQMFGSLPGKADDIAEREFPGSARDSSTKNAFRHALGTGMMAQELGGGAVGAGLAKGAGYLWEGMGAMDFIDSAKHRTDTLHDLNANALGASAAQRTGNTTELVEALKAMAAGSVQQRPPGVFESSPGYMTRTVR